MAIVRANGIDLRVSRYASRAGRGSPVVVLIHGLTVDHSGMGFTLGMPLSAAADVILYDLRGHGRSQFVTAGYRVADHLADLTDLLDALDVTAPVHLVGGSYGGVVATTAAARHPERVGSLSLIEGMLPHEGWGTLVSEIVERAADQLSGDFTADQAMEVLGIPSPRKAMAVARRAGRLILETTLRDDIRAEPALDPAEYARIRCPVQGIYGDRSHLFPLRDTLGQLVPEARTHTVPGADHLEVFLHTRALKPLIADFVREVASRSEASTAAPGAGAGAAARAAATGTPAVGTAGS